MPDEQIAPLERRRAELCSQLASIGEMRSGSLTERCRRCGRARCGCAPAADAGRGPVLSLTRKRSGKTATRLIPAPAASAIRAEVAEYRHFRRLTKELIEVSDALSEVRLTAAGRAGDAEAVGAEAVGAEAVGAEAVGAEAVGAEAVGAEAVGAGAVGAEAVKKKRAPMTRSRSAPNSTRC